jgi:hypothetical protein
VCCKLCEGLDIQRKQRPLCSHLSLGGSIMRIGLGTNLVILVGWSSRKSYITVSGSENEMYACRTKIPDNSEVCTTSHEFLVALS